ncbi:MAG TPA: enoyl-CoA hydratase-related protein [Dehalococcoidia bacterium]|nr:enoyl-CoA hydratase-related protein [Dehalococcoidia bacterium]
MAYENIVYTVEGKVATLMLNRPDKLNAMSGALLDEFEKVLTEFEQNNAARVLVIRGAGRAFSAGYDIGGGRDEGERVEMTADRDRDGLQAGALRWLRLWEMRKPTIAMVHGFCLAGASEMAAMADLTYVAEDARIGFPSLPIGSGDIETFWYWFVGPKRTKEIVWLLGTQISGRKAYEWGFANEVFPADKLEEETYKHANLIARLPLELLNLKKQSVNRIMEFQGFRAAVMSGAEWDAIAHVTKPVKEMQQRMREQGMQGAIKWFNEEA